LFSNVIAKQLFLYFRISLLTISIGCACGTFVLAGYLFRHRRVKVFKVASPIFLMITLIGCAIYRQPSAETPTISGGKLLTTLTGSSSWARGSYQCLCRAGFYSLRHPDGFNGTIMEIAWQEQQDNISNYYTEVFKCLPCAPGCDTCTGPEPCLANYHWPFRLVSVSVIVCQ